MALVFPVVHDFDGTFTQPGIFGELWAWGINDAGQVGDGTTTDRNTPQKIGSSNSWEQVASGNSHSLGIRNGELWAWGVNDKGQLGDGTTTQRLSPVRIGNDDDWQQIGAGHDFSAGIKNGGEIWAWGDNSHGQMGDGTETNRISPVRVGLDSDWDKIEVGASSVFAIKTNGELWAWGRKVYGNFGNGGLSFTEELSPIRIGSASDWEMISNSGSHTLGIRNGGQLWSCGYNLDGATGLGTTSGSTTTFTRVGTASDWNKVVAANGNYCLAIKNGGELWAWGIGSFGSLGRGSTSSISTPTRVGSASDWLDIEAIGLNSFGIKGNKELWAWGYNAGGVLGDGTTTQRNEPIRIGSDNDWELIQGMYGTVSAIKG